MHLSLSVRLALSATCRGSGYSPGRGIKPGHVVIVGRRADRQELGTCRTDARVLSDVGGQTCTHSQMSGAVVGTCHSRHGYCLYMYTQLYTSEHLKADSLSLSRWRFRGSIYQQSQCITYSKDVDLYVNCDIQTPTDFFIHSSEESQIDSMRLFCTALITKPLTIKLCTIRLEQLDTFLAPLASKTRSMHWPCNAMNALLSFSVRYR